LQPVRFSLLGFFSRGKSAIEKHVQTAYSPRTTRRNHETILFAVIVIFVATGLALGQPQKRLEPDKGVRPCLPASGLEVTLRTTGAYLLGSTIGIGADSNLWAETPLAKKPSECETTSDVVPRGNWRWQILSRPAQSTSQLTGTNEASVTLLLDQLGDYRIRATACAFDCEIELPNRRTVIIPPESREIVIRVLAILPRTKRPFCHRSPRSSRVLPRFPTIAGGERTLFQPPGTRSSHGADLTNTNFWREE